jgi:hypothetical protein
MSATTCFQGNWTWSSSNSTKIESIGFAVYPGNSNRFSYSADATTSSGAIPNISIVYNLPEVQEAIEGTFDNQLIEGDKREAPKYSSAARTYLPMSNGNGLSISK